MSVKRVLVLYYTRGVWPMRDAIWTHLYCWQRYSRHKVCYVNVAFGFPWRILRRLNFDIVVFHTIFLSMRWSPDIFRKFTGYCAPLADYDCIKLALPQDEFIHTDLLSDYLQRVGVTHIGSCAVPEEWSKIYRRLDRSKITFRTVLTGYLDDATVARIATLAASNPIRSIDIGYRAWRAQFWLGEQGMHKVWVAEKFLAAGRQASLRVDISLRDEDVLSGDDWFKFLLQCRTTIGVEGGASVCDADGSIRERVDNYLHDHVDATFEQVRDACFPKEDNTLKLACISPRHLEACVTKTCQILVEGNYSGILEAGKHYIEVKRDYSNINDVIAAIQDDQRVNEVATVAYRDIVESKNWTYERFVSDIEREIFDPYPARYSVGGQSALARVYLIVRDWSHWQYIRLEVFTTRYSGVAWMRAAIWMVYRFCTRVFGMPPP